MPKLFTFVAIVLLLIAAGVFGGIVGFSQGYQKGTLESQTAFEDFLSENNIDISSAQEDKTVVYSSPTSTPFAYPKWGGPELWEAVNARRKEFGVNTLASQAEICTVASIRLNELLELGKLDGHEGFSSLPERRSDLTWIYEKYTLSEFLLSGAKTPQEAVSLWENTLGHKKLLTGGEYVWGCIYAQAGFAVAITAY